VVLLFLANALLFNATEGYAAEVAGIFHAKESRQIVSLANIKTFMTRKLL
jgi:hypothetical protein